MTRSGPSSSSLRIVGGRHRSRVIRFPALPGVRPTPDRVRETLFNWLGQDLAGMTTLEPYAGSGALSLEALSRGARLSVAWDAQRAVVRALAENAALLGETGLEVRCTEATAALRQETRVFDVIFLDPPFDDDPWPWLFEACAERLKPGGWLYAEAGRLLMPPVFFELFRQGRAGQVFFHLFCRV
ncbi:MAG: 16S rRNA (guanine(966)-N(2))-methyltransferase RsmD [Proteobacteria bacterium]|nr:16S rRNA (guanine(966)-N(2))-methyltransferase RsmD [Pseudomonadota bacterium]MCL2307884.1 16S rRNA (guanine(966)-N(2))-methyltransferase RsmD [Pseudomonadota bacterium]